VRCSSSFEDGEFVLKIKKETEKEEEETHMRGKIHNVYV
jgi:hypothetical protein